mmetsp:Transcript_16396/g.40500  ORF Transcript_16396/g.40500 Transcript_16396/m.40500 type:complete len:799 (+) Transcript_16396:141-2537(+)|eukprot:CAMPEP_0178998864 /NCGR_PEP_ID=MMETSP0795-20121207/9738_1 /TAXON_ID=88552 /ORGANISM="Amoebophrya sp., Strain Ameob2" /LENGTH=798 /DNA_ID=CAMNT_0020691567 /DNA_START=102 /DNA_END=2498 /DNA_ORIENTATION=-
MESFTTAAFKAASSTPIRRADRSSKHSTNHTVARHTTHSPRKAAPTPRSNRGAAQSESKCKNLRTEADSSRIGGPVREREQSGRETKSTRLQRQSLVHEAVEIAPGPDFPVVPENTPSDAGDAPQQGENDDGNGYGAGTVQGQEETRWGHENGAESWANALSDKRRAILRRIFDSLSVYSSGSGNRYEHPTAEHSSADSEDSDDGEDQNGTFSKKVERELDKKLHKAFFYLDKEQTGVVQLGLLRGVLLVGSSTAVLSDERGILKKELGLLMRQVEPQLLNAGKEGLTAKEFALLIKAALKNEHEALVQLVTAEVFVDVDGTGGHFADDGGAEGHEHRSYGDAPDARHQHQHNKSPTTLSCPGAASRNVKPKREHQGGSSPQPLTLQHGPLVLPGGNITISLGPQSPAAHNHNHKPPSSAQTIQLAKNLAGAANAIRYNLDTQMTNLLHMRHHYSRIANAKPSVDNSHYGPRSQCFHSLLMNNVEEHFSSRTTNGDSTDMTKTNGERAVEQGGTCTSTQHHWNEYEEKMARRKLQGMRMLPLERMHLLLVNHPAVKDEYRVQVVNENAGVNMVFGGMDSGLMARSVGGSRSASPSVGRGGVTVSGRGSSPSATGTEYHLPRLGGNSPSPRNNQGGPGAAPTLLEDAAPPPSRGPVAASPLHKGSGGASSPRRLLLGPSKQDVDGRSVVVNARSPTSPSAAAPQHRRGCTTGATHHVQVEADHASSAGQHASRHGNRTPPTPPTRGTVTPPGGTGSRCCAGESRGLKQDSDFVAQQMVKVGLMPRRGSVERRSSLERCA